MILKEFAYYLFFLLIGYGLGRRIGIKEGYSKGIAVSPLNLRKKSLENGKCMICDNKIE